jgi:hypothetical protein
MDEQAKADLEKLDTLREQALCGPEEEREKAEQAYEELRETLFDHQACEIPDDQQETRELPRVEAFTCEGCGQSYALGGDQAEEATGSQSAALPTLCPACRNARQGDRPA